MGLGPTNYQISFALLVYTFCAILLALWRLVDCRFGDGGFWELGYLSAFYLFYHFAGMSPENALAVFSAGLTILGLDRWNHWNYQGRAIEEEQASSLGLEGRPRKESG
jgi:hypothetical protein